MGFFKKLASSVTSTVKSVAKSVETVAKSPIKVTGSLIKGDVKGAVKEVGKGVGGAANAATAGLLTRGDTKKLLNSSLLNAVTLNTGKEIANVGQGFRDFETKGEANKRFYQSGLALGAKAVTLSAAAAYAPSAYNAKNALTSVGIARSIGNKNLAGVIGGAAQLEGVPSIDIETPGWIDTAKDVADKAKDTIKKVKNYLPSSPSSSSSGQSYALETMSAPSAPASESGSNLTTPLIVAGALAATGVGLPVAAGVAAGTLLLTNKKDA